MSECKKNLYMIDMADKVPVNTYLRYSIPLSIALYEKEAWKWFQSALIQLKCKRDDSQILVLFNRVPNLKIKMSFSYRRKKYSSEKIISKVVKKISNGYCVSTLLDQFYISGTLNYKKKHFLHREFIVGCDIENEKFFLKTYGKEGYIVNSEMSFSDFLFAYYWKGKNPEKKSWFASIYYYKRKENAKPRFNYRCFYHSISCYVKSKMSLLCKFYIQGTMVIDRENTFRCVYGINVHDHLANLIYSNYKKDNINYIPLIKLDMIYVHKQCMVERFVFLRDEYIVNIFKDENEISIMKSCLNEAIEYYKTIEKNYLIFKRLYMKAQQTGDKQILLRIVEGINRMTLLEKETLEKLLPYLALILNH